MLSLASLGITAFGAPVLVALQDGAALSIGAKAGIASTLIGFGTFTTGEPPRSSAVRTTVHGDAMGRAPVLGRVALLGAIPGMPPLLDVRPHPGVSPFTQGCSIGLPRRTCVTCATTGPPKWSALKP